MIKGIAIGMAIIFGIVIGLMCLFRREIATLMTLERKSDYPFFEIEYKSDYRLDKFLEKGASTDDEFKNIVSRLLLKGLPVTAHPEGACSTFVATSPGGDVMLGRNFDYKPSVCLLVRTAPKDGYSSISMVDLCHIGYSEQKGPDKSMLSRINVLAAPYMCLDGINEKGLAVAILTAREQIVHQKRGNVPIMTTSAVRLLLDKAATVDEAIMLLDSYDMNSSGKIGYHFQIADSAGDTAVVEYLNDKMVVLRRSESALYLAATNFTLSTKEKDGIGQERYEIIMSGLKKRNAVMTEEESMGLLEEAFLDGHKIYKDPSHMYYNSRTQWSAVYNLSAGTVMLCIGGDYERKYRYDFT